MAMEGLLDRRSIWNIDVDIKANYTNGLTKISRALMRTSPWSMPLITMATKAMSQQIHSHTQISRMHFSNLDTGRIYRGRGGTDTLKMHGINKRDILEFNGSAVNDLGHSAAGGAAIGKQAIYGGTVFDVLNLNNGDEIYLQGIEKSECTDGDIQVRANMSDSTKEQWNLQAMDVSGAWRFNRGSSDVVLASLDAGIGDLSDQPD